MSYEYTQKNDVKSEGKMSRIEIRHVVVVYILNKSAAEAARCKELCIDNTKPKI